MLRRLIGEDVEVRTTLQADLGAIKADPSQLEQVIMNLVINARDAMPAGGKLTIETANTYLDETYAEQHLSVSAGDYVMLAVSDTGVGMDEETRQHIFEPFFTTKDTGRGTGLGLSTVYGIVKQSGGNIWVYSELEGGTTFKIYLPRVNEGVEVTKQVALNQELPLATETILLVEDDQALRELVQEVLELAGYQVLEAVTGEAAISICEHREKTIHLLVTDVVMPEIVGPELAERLLALHPEMRTLYISGYADDAIVHHGVLAEGTNFLAKPFSPRALELKVREVLKAADED
jgi:CheY-like chemotaxis protein